VSYTRSLSLPSHNRYLTVTSSSAEAQRLCVVYQVALHSRALSILPLSVSPSLSHPLYLVHQYPQTAVEAWQVRVAAKLARLPPPPTNSTEPPVDVQQVVSSIDYGNWARERGAGANSSWVEGWVMGGFRAHLPFNVADYYQYYWLYHLLLSLWTYTFTTTAAVMIVAGTHAVTV